MDYPTYQRIYQGLSSLEDVEQLAIETGVEREVVFSILCLKLVREAKARYRGLRKNSAELRKAWERGRSFLAISRELGFPPVLTASIILQATGLSRKQVWRLLKKGAEGRVARELEEAKKADFLYSPRAHRRQMCRARIGEEILRNWLISNKIEFTAEKDAIGRKTPDFLLKKGLCIHGLRIRWIESKAVFGDEIEHKRYYKKQYQDYLREFGKGMVVYWYGFLDSLPSLEPRIIVKDHTFFPESESKLLFNMEEAFQDVAGSLEKRPQHPCRSNNNNGWDTESAGIIQSKPPLHQGKFRGRRDCS